MLKNEKVKTTDEFLVKKKRAFVLPPDYEKVPEPGFTANKKKKKKKIKSKKF